MAGIDSAVSAFETDINGTSSRTVENDDEAPAEQMFIREHELDVEAGGDGDPDPEPPPEQRTKPAKRKAEAEDDEEDDPPLDPLDAEEDDDEDSDKEDEDEDEDEDDDPDTEIDPSDFDNAEFEITVDGEPAKVTGKEMKDGYIRTQTFHQRLNKLNEASQVMQREAAVLVQDRQTYVEKLKEAEALLEELTPAEPDWDKLFDEEPKKAHALRKQYDELGKKKAALIQRRKDAEAEHAKAQTIEYKKWVANEEAKIAADNPEWADPKRKQRELQSMVKTARSAGFADEEIVNTHDSRMVKILKKAAAYDRIMAAREAAKPVKRGKKPVGSGAGSRRTAPRGKNRASQQLARTGSLEAATAVFGEILRNQ